MAKTITHDENGNASWGEENHLQAAQSRSFASMIFETLSEKTPTDSQLKIFELILNLSIDHGPETPSAVKVIEAAKEGKNISESLSAGILEINDVHGGAGEPLMEILYKVNSGQVTVDRLVEEYLKEGKRMPGLGHRLYKQSLPAEAGKGGDPRVLLIFEKMKEEGLGEEFIKIVEDIQDELEKQKGLRLPINIDGAIAVALCSFGWESKLGKAVFLVARMPGLCGQFLNNSNP